jgi:hypothetical protein
VRLLRLGRYKIGKSDRKRVVKIKKFTITCDFPGFTAPFDFYVGEPTPGLHPLHYQAAWLSRERGGTVPRKEMDEFARLRDIALENGVSFEELCIDVWPGGSDVAEPPQRSS